jgi:hypothetical protein
MCKEDWAGFTSTKNGAQPAGSAIRRANGSPPSGSVIEPSQFAQPGRFRRGVGRDVFEDLERVQRADRLAAGRAEIRFEAGAIAAVGVAIRGQGRQCGLGGAAAQDQLGPAPVEQPGVGCHELGDPVEVTHGLIVCEVCRGI